MILYILKRLLNTVPTLLILVSLIFFLMRLAPGGPFDAEHVWSAEVQANILARYGLDQPLTAQYWQWLKDLAHGDLRESFQYLDQPVSALIKESLPYSALIGGLAILVSILIGVPLGALGAWKRGSAWDLAATFSAIAGVSLPTYLVGSILVLIFSNWLGLLPPALAETPAHFVLPVLTLSARPLAMIARLTRASLLESLGADYIRTARAKGLDAKHVLFKHALKNALIPVVTLLGPLIASLITGSFLVETIFQIPGMGKHFVGSVLNRDYPLVMGITLFYGTVLMLSNLLVDLAYGWIDPRVRLSK